MANVGDGIEMGNVNAEGVRKDWFESLAALEIQMQMEMMEEHCHDTSEIIRRKRMARTALTVWSEKLKNLEQNEDQLKAAISSTKNEVYQLMSLYSVFAGVVFTAVATSSRLECQHLWSPVGFCVFVHSMLIVMIFKQFITISELKKSIAMENLSRKVVLRWINRLKQIGYMDFDFGVDCEYRGLGLRYDRYSDIFKALWLAIPTTIFTAGLIGSFIHILCRTKG